MSWFRYVRHHDIGRMYCQGWFFCTDLGHPHGQWSVLMQWGGRADPPEIRAT